MDNPDDAFFHMQQYLLPMGNVAGIIDTKSNSKDDVDAGDDVDGDAPEMEEAYEVNEGEDDGEKDDATEADAAQEEECDNKHSKQGETQIPPELPSNNLVRLPGRIHQGVAER